MMFLTSELMLQVGKFVLLNVASLMFLRCPCFTKLDFSSMRKTSKFSDQILLLEPKIKTSCLWCV